MGTQLQAWVEEGRIPGIAAGVGTAQGPAMLQAAGFADLATGVAIQARETVFRVASISKPITATALARMVASGSLSLDDPLKEYVPEYPHPGITLRHLASHTAGVRGYRGKEVASNRPMDIAESLRIFQDDPLVFSPGEGYLYTSFDFVLLSLAMERASGLPFDRLVEKEVLAPLGMSHTSMEVPGNPKEGQAMFYSRRRNGLVPATPVDNRYKLAGGGYLSTVTDILRLGQAYLRGEVATPSVLKPFLSSVQIHGAFTWYGLGWEVSEDAGGEPYYGHTGNSIGAYSIFRVYPDSGCCVAVLINSSDPGLQSELESLIDVLKGQARYGSPGRNNQPSNA